MATDPTPRTRTAPMSTPNAQALLALVLAGGGSAARRGLLERCGDPARALAAGSAGWHAAGLDGRQIAALAAPDAAAIDAGLAWLAASPSHHLLGWHDPDYPPLLRRIASPPLTLFIEGDATLLWQPAIAVVGSRSPSAGGRDTAREFSRALVRAGMVVVSGMAAGIDAAAHLATLEMAGGHTVAVLGTGPDVAYPRQHAMLRERIAAQGAVVSEHLPGTPPQRSHFPSRNRIIAGLTLGTLVVEAAERSGALITARQAGEEGREVFAIPGSIHNPMARGCHRLIRDGAALVETAGEIIEAVLPLASGLAEELRTSLGAGPTGPGPGMAKPDIDPDYQMLWNALGFDPTPMDSLVERTGLTTAALSSMLLVMELDGRVTAQHGRYTRRA